MTESAESDATRSADTAGMEREWVRQLDEIGLDRVMKNHARCGPNQDPLRWNWTENWIWRQLDARLVSERAEKAREEELRQEALVEQKRHNAKTRVISFIALLVAVLSVAWNAYGGRG